MALPSSGQITLKQIGTEFGTTPTLKSNYGKGGASASGDITIKEFYGRSNRTSNIYVYNGGQFNQASPGYSIDQQNITSEDEAGGTVYANYPGMNWAGVYTTAGGDDYFGFDWTSGLAWELGQWNYVGVSWGNGGLTEAYGRYDWIDVGVGGYDFVVLDDLYPSLITDNSGWTLAEYIRNGWGFTVTIDNRL